MAATIAKATGGDSSREKSVQRLGDQYSTAHANTWKTFTTCHVNKDGSGYVEVERIRTDPPPIQLVTLHRFDFEKE